MLNAEFNFAETRQTVKASRFCARCGKSIKHKEKRAKYCGLDCSAKSNGKKSGSKKKLSALDKYQSKKDEIIKAYQSGATCLQIAQTIPKATKKSVSQWLKRWGVFDASRPKPQLTKGYRGHIKQPPPEKHLADAWRNEWGGVPAEDCWHWLKHPERLRFNYNKAAKAQFRKWKHHPLKAIVRTQRIRVHHMITKPGFRKSLGTLELIGCTKLELQQHIQSQFKDGMAWNNYGTLWEVDHIRPCASFDLTKPEDQRACFHYTNLRPLNKSENRKKHAWWNGFNHRTVK